MTENLAMIVVLAAVLVVLARGIYFKVGEEKHENSK